MQPFDFSSVVPVDASALLNSVGAFMGLSIIGAILMFRIGLRFGPMLFRGIQQAFQRGAVLDWGVFERASQNDTAYREELIGLYKDETGKVELVPAWLGNTSDPVRRAELLRREKDLGDPSWLVAANANQATTDERLELAYNYQRTKDIGPFADHVASLSGDDQADLQEWLYYTFDDPTFQEITDGVDKRRTQKALQRWRELDRTQDDEYDDIASETAI